MRKEVLELKVARLALGTGESISAVEDRLSRIEEATAEITRGIAERRIRPVLGRRLIAELRSLIDSESLRLAVLERTFVAGIVEISTDMKIDEVQ